MAQPPARSDSYVCPICSVVVSSSDGGRPAGATAKPGNTGGSRYRPFCSARCQRIDLGNWLGERYAVPGEPALEEPESGARDADDGRDLPS